MRSVHGFKRLELFTKMSFLYGVVLVCKMLAVKVSERLILIACEWVSINCLSSTAAPRASIA